MFGKNGITAQSFRVRVPIWCTEHVVGDGKPRSHRKHRAVAVFVVVVVKSHAGSVALACREEGGPLGVPLLLAFAFGFAAGRKLDPALLGEDLLGRPLVLEDRRDGLGGFGGELRRWWQLALEALGFREDHVRGRGGLLAGSEERIDGSRWLLRS